MLKLFVVMSVFIFLQTIQCSDDKPTPQTLAVFFDAAKKIPHTKKSDIYYPPLFLPPSCEKYIWKFDPKPVQHWPKEATQKTN